MKNLLYLFCLIICPSLAWANDPPDFLFRCDTRSPDEIQQAGGFYPHNNGRIRDYDLAHHFTGESVEHYTSAFVSTSSDLKAVVNHCLSMVGSDQSAWIYMIMPGSNFYSVSSSLQRVRDSHVAGSPEWQRINQLIIDYDGMSEYVAVDGFPFGRVISHAELNQEMVDDYYDDEDSVLYSNDFWEDRWNLSDAFNADFDGEQPSDSPYLVVDEPASQVVLALNEHAMELPLRFVCDAANGFPASSRSRASSHSCPRYEIIKRLYDKQIISSIIL
ncbi:enterotoxin A family protein [uncultured Xanthomonas sp.]|uniref:enterotoxin A family protein n=1 Tax=uncultured Xanthomonas sp. TaxID=152831 RepID=UPI0025D10F4F|nr:enterotoxin A family protein [uncultured Xanthomonas sp.]